MKDVIFAVGLLLLAACGSEHTTSLPAAPSAPPVNYTIGGTVRDRAGRPLEGINISMVVTTRGAPLWKTDAAGQYQIKVTPGTYTFIFWIPQPGFVQHRETVRIDSDTTLDIVLLPPSGP